MSDVLLSIIIPAYNAGDFLTDTLNMLINQNLEFCEVIIINDGSTDNTGEICRCFSNKYPAISYITQENKGVSVARNRGLALAKGRCVCFFDSDDALPDGTLGFFKSVLLKNTAVEIFSFGYEMRRDGRIIKKYISPKFDKKVLNSNILQESFFSKKLSCNICSCIYDRAFLKKNKIVFTEGLKIGEDVEFIIKAISVVNYLYYEQRVGFLYQLRDNSAMKGYRSYNYDRFHSFEILRDTILNLKKEKASLEKEMNFFIANLYLSNLIAYLKSDMCAHDMNSKFLFNRKYLYYPIRGKYLNLMFIFITRFIPINLVLKIFKNV